MVVVVGAEPPKLVRLLAGEIEVVDPLVDILNKIQDLPGTGMLPLPGNHNLLLLRIHNLQLHLPDTGLEQYLEAALLAQPLVEVVQVSGASSFGWPWP